MTGNRDPGSVISTDSDPDKCFLSRGEKTSLPAQISIHVSLPSPLKKILFKAKNKKRNDDKK